MSLSSLLGCRHVVSIEDKAILLYSMKAIQLSNCSLRIRGRNLHLLVRGKGNILKSMKRYTEKMFEIIGVKVSRATWLDLRA